MSSSTAESIRKTAYDALLAKHSAFILAGHHPLCLPTTEGDEQGHAVNAAASRLYCDLLTRMTATTSTTGRRQTPLVNAGYTHRVSTILQGILQFLQFHATEPVVNLLILGAGLDVTGLWAAIVAAVNGGNWCGGDSLAGTSRQPQIRHVVEVDQVEVCAAKRERLLAQQMVLEDVDNDDNNNHHGVEAVSNKNGYFLHKARIPHRPSSSSNTKATYTLLAVDLRQLDQLEQMLLPHFTTSTHHPPTLIVSELVLSYLTQPQQQAVLQFCCQQLLSSPHHPDSALLAYEALGPSEKNGTTTATNVLQHYQSAYRDQFAEKLDRGLAKTTTTTTKTAQAESHDSESDDLSGGDADNNSCSGNNNNTPLLFVPVGTCCQQLETTWKHQCGFAHVHATSAGDASWWYRAVVSAAAKHNGNSTTLAATATATSATAPPELFDEHAALTLHLQSYALVWAFATKEPATISEHPNDSSTGTTCLLRRWTCPWTTGSLVRHVSLPCNTWLTIVEQCDETAVRVLYEQSYGQYMGEYASIRKMVKTSLRKDLALSTTTNTATTTKAETFSRIRQSYLQQGGDFWVVIRRIDSSSTGAAAATTAATVPSSQRVVLGGIGLRRCSPAEEVAHRSATETASTSWFHETCYYEIHRLFVREEYRGQGIASALVRHATDWALQKSSGAIALLATTPAVLGQANHFYPSRGFALLHSEHVGELSMRTFILRARKV